MWRRQYPGAIGFWLVGACGDQFPGYRSKRYTIDKNKNWTYGVDLHDAGFALLEAAGGTPGQRDRPGGPDHQDNHH